MRVNFPKHYGPDSWNKNVRISFVWWDRAYWVKKWIYRGDDWLFVRRWEQLIAMRHRVDIAQVISWNGEFLHRLFFVLPSIFISFELLILLTPI